ncbi:L-threonylcarbamoyladenylate synthase [Leptospira sp. 96542]|nr:L-threonylcarbamoyladenylate synthase [Leptospira sp. 96542]
MDTLVSTDVGGIASLIRLGKIVIFPTETVYGIGASSLDESACSKIYEIKNRPKDNPLIAHFDSIEQIKEYCELPEIGEKVLKKYAPGPITLVLQKKNKNLFPKELSTVACRIPGLNLARELIQKAGVPISAPSANLSGRPSLTKLKDVLYYFEGKVDGVLVGEEPSVGIESTVVDLTAVPPLLLRPGSVEFEDLKKEIPDLVLYLPIGSESPKSPGLKYKHYSPDAKMILLPTNEFKHSFSFLQNETNGEFLDSFGELQKPIAWIGFSLPESKANPFQKKVVDNAEYREVLYSFLESADRSGFQTIICETPKPGLGFEGLYNRLKKAKSN